MIVTVLGLITGHSAEASFIWIGATYVLIVDQLRSKGPRTRVLLNVSIIYASIFAIGMVISINDNLADTALWPWIIHHIILRGIS